MEAASLKFIVFIALILPFLPLFVFVFVIFVSSQFCRWRIAPTVLRRSDGDVQSINPVLTQLLVELRQIAGEVCALLLIPIETQNHLRQNFAEAGKEIP